MSRNFYLSSRRTLDGGTNTFGGSRGEETQYNSLADNIIELPARNPIGPTSDLSQDRDFLHDDDRNSGVVCIAMVVLSFFAACIGAGLYLGSLIFNFFDFG